MGFHSRFTNGKRHLLNVKPTLEILEDRLAPAATFTVNTTLDVLNANDGKLSLREAITKANDHPGADTIVVPAGVYKISIPPGPGPVNNSGAFDILDSVTLQGAGAGTTIVDAQHLDRVFAVTGTAPSSITVTFRGLTVRGGFINGNGGGIVVGNADLTLRGCVVTGNTASGNGAGISNALNPGTGNLTVIRTTVSRNVAGNAGGILWAGDAQGGGSNLSLSNSRVRRNLAGSMGGGLSAGRLTLTNTAVSGNSAGIGGGGIIALTTTLTRSIVSGNTAARDGGGILSITVATLIDSTVSGNSTGTDGGGIHALGTVTLTSSTVSGNTAGGNGGGIHALGTVTLTTSTINGNTASDGNGGGIGGPAAILTSSTVSGNSARTFGGGIAAGTAILTNSTVSGNTAGANGGGIFAGAMTLANDTIAENIAANGGGVFHNGTSNPATVKNTIIALNLIRFGGIGPDVNGDFDGLHGNLIGIVDGSSGFLLLGGGSGLVGFADKPLDPKLGPLANNGGPTKTHALLRRSLAIDAGSEQMLAALSAAVNAGDTTLPVSSAVPFVPGMLLRLGRELVVVASLSGNTLTV